MYICIYTVYICIYIYIYIYIYIPQLLANTEENQCLNLCIYPGRWMSSPLTACKSRFLFYPEPMYVVVTFRSGTSAFLYVDYVFRSRSLQNPIENRFLTVAIFLAVFEGVFEGVFEVVIFAKSASAMLCEKLDVVVTFRSDPSGFLYVDYVFRH